MSEAIVTMHRTPIVWVLVADGHRAQVYVIASHEKLIPIRGNARDPRFEACYAQELLPIADMKWEGESSEIYNVERNSTGMVFESVGSVRHMGEPHLDARDEVKQHFIQSVAHHINVARLDRRFDEIIVIAPPRVLGQLRLDLDDYVAEAVIAEVSKDLTKSDLSIIYDYVVRAIENQKN